MKYVPILDKNYKPAVLELRQFQQDVLASKKANKIAICLLRNNGYVYRFDMDVYQDGVNDERNFFIVERVIKSMLWVVGGYKIYLAGSHTLYQKIKAAYQDKGLRDFDYHFMSGVYEHDFEVEEATFDTLPAVKESSVPAGGHLEGNRIGFDAGGSDRKVSAVVDGKTIYSEEVVWFPKTNEDPKYHYDGIYTAMKTAAEKMGNKIDAIGVSSAGVYIDNKIMVASLFVKVPKDLFEKHVKYMYIDIAKQLEKEVGHPIPLEVANDGDVTALAGAMELKDTNVLGIAMGTSEAAGYVDSNGNLTGWLNELAFVPVDFNKDAMVDEWSLDYGCGVKYFSQDAVIKLAPAANIELDPSLSPAEKLKVVQKLSEQDDPRAHQIYETIGVYLGYAIAYYSVFYSIKHILLLGRVTSGKGGNIILKKAKEVLENEFPEYASIHLTMPDETNRRVGQSIAAASLPKIDK